MDKYFDIILAVQEQSNFDSHCIPGIRTDLMDGCRYCHAEAFVKATLNVHLARKGNFSFL